MELYIYDTSLNLKGIIDEISSFIWTRRYWSCGEFKLLTPFTENNEKLLKKGNIIMKNIHTDSEAAQINYITIKRNTYGLEEIEVQGKFIAAWLDARIILTPIIVIDTAHNIINRIVSENLINPSEIERAIPLLELETNSADLDSNIISYSSEPFISCLLETETIAKANSLGFKIQTDLQSKKHIFKVYEGKDLTANQTTYNPCIFAEDFDNIYEQEYENSTENLRSVCYVGGEKKDNAERQIVKVGTAVGLDRKELFVDASDIVQTYTEGSTEITMTSSEYINNLTERGMNTLEQYSETLNFSAKINTQSNLKYKTDFDIGDLVTCINKKWGIKVNARITEITETYQKNNNSIDVTFGESFPTLFDKINRIR